MKTARSGKNNRTRRSDDGSQSLTFAALEQRITAMPDGPSSVLNTPAWLLPFQVVGTLGIIVGLAPSLMIQFIEPRQWMVVMAKLGLGMTLAYLPGIARNTWVVFREFWRWQSKLVEQSDHDVLQFRTLRVWLRRFPQEQLKELHHFAAFSQQRLSAKLGLLQGGFDKLGVLPALLALLVLLRSAGDLSLDRLSKVPVWQSVLALMFAITYLISFLAMRMRLRLQLYEMVLSDALDSAGEKGAEGIKSP